VVTTPTTTRPAGAHRDSLGKGVAPPGRPVYLSRERKIVAAGCALGLVLFLFGWYRHATYRSRTFDLAYFDQALWLLSHGHIPLVTVIGRNIFTDHFSPAMVLFVPFYALAPSPIWLIGSHAVALGVGLVALGPLLDEFRLTDRWRQALMVAYAFNPLLWTAALFDFHMTTLAVPFLIVGLTAALRDDLRTLTGVSFALLLIRDDLGLAVMGLVLIGIMNSEHVRARVAVAVVAIAWVLIAGRFGQTVDSPELWQAHYGYLGSTPGVAVHHSVRSLARTAETIWSFGNFTTMVAWLLPLGFLPLLWPGRALLGLLWVLPLFASARFSAGILPALHHGVVVLPFLLLATATAITALRSSHRLVDFAGPWVVIALALSSLYAADPFSAWIGNTRAPSPSLAREALQHVRSSDAVTATSTLGPHLAHRVLLLPFPYPFMRGDDLAPLDASVTRTGLREVARIDAVAIYMGFDGSTSRIRRAFLRSPYLSDFRLVFDRGGLLVFRRVRASTSP
jgi:uncharacterized membrane protein